MLNPVTPQDVMVDESDDEEEAGDEHDARRALTAALEGLGSGKGRCQRRIMAHRTGRTPPTLFKGLCIGYSPRRGSAGVRSHLGQRILVVHDGSACMRDACVHSGL